MRKFCKASAILLVIAFHLSGPALGWSETLQENIYNPGRLKPFDSVLKVKVGERAPDFSLPSVTGEKISLAQFQRKKNVVISFVPAAWTPVCSDQWPGYNIVKEMFEKNDAVLLGITVDNIPSLYAWTREMGGLWFHVMSDFWPHGAVAARYGVLRSDGVTERALFIVDKNGVLRFVHVSDINKKPDLAACTVELEKLNKR